METEEATSSTRSLRRKRNETCDPEETSNMRKSPRISKLKYIKLKESSSDDSNDLYCDAETVGTSKTADAPEKCDTLETIFIDETDKHRFKSIQENVSTLKEVQPLDDSLTSMTYSVENGNVVLLPNDVEELYKQDVSSAAALLKELRNQTNQKLEKDG